MQYSKEIIYRKFGQYDKVVTILFRPNTGSSQLYLDRLTGVFLYNPSERKELEKNKDSIESNFGFIKFHELLNKIPDDKRKELEKVGINCEDIHYILHVPIYEEKNEYANDGIKQLDKPIEITIDLDEYDNDVVMLNLMSNQIKKGHILTIDEIHHYLGLNVYFNKIDLSKIQDPQYIDNLTGEVYDGITKNYLECKDRHEGLSSSEKTILSDIRAKQLMTKIGITKNEIKRAGYSKKSMDEIKPQLEIFSDQLIKFNSLRLNHSKYPVWLNFERFAHIFFSHVRETNLGRNLKDKSKFQYHINDVVQLIKNVIEENDEAIQKNFVDSEKKGFKRHGEMSVYYRGDYYIIDISENGLLMTFYKKN